MLYAITCITSLHIEQEWEDEECRTQQICSTYDPRHLKCQGQLFIVQALQQLENGNVNLIVLIETYVLQEMWKLLVCVYKEYLLQSRL